MALPGGSWAAEPGQPLIAKLNPNTGAFTMVANLTQLVGKGAPLREAWGIMTGEAGTWPVRPNPRAIMRRNNR